MHKMYANLSRARPVAMLIKVDNGQSLCNFKTGTGMIEFECFWRSLYAGPATTHRNSTA